MPDATRPHRLIPFVLAACTGVSILSTDLVAPSIPDLPKIFATDAQTAQMVVGINLLAYALAHLVHGPISEVLGRRLLLLSAFGLFALASIAAMFAGSIEALLAMRFVQGLFSSVPSVVVILIIRELYGRAGSVRVLALYGFAIGAAPALGPLIGSYLHVWFGWRAGFLLCAVLALTVSLWVAWLVPETLSAKRTVRPAGVVGDYRRLLTRGRYLRPALGGSLAFGAYFAYISTAPLIFRDVFDLPVQRFGLSTLLIVGAFMVGSLASARAAAAVPAERMLGLSALLLIFSVSLLTVPLALGPPRIEMMMIAMTLYGIALAGVLATAPIIVLDAAPDLPQGQASALLGALQLGAGAAAGLISGAFYDETVVSMVLTISAFAVSGALLLLLPHIRVRATA